MDEQQERVFKFSFADKSMPRIERTPEWNGNKSVQFSLPEVDGERIPVPLESHYH